VEVATGVVLMIDPAIVVALLLGAGNFDERVSLGQFLGIALFALGLACWPGQTLHAAALRAVLV
jgi:hypothetical protein